jgi:thiosulfate dehydrogenase [quinone] large subunit
MSAANQQARALAFLRIAVGLLFLIFAQYKLRSAQFIHHGMANYIGHFIQNGCYPFMRPFLTKIILPHAVFFGAIVAITELLIALSLITGVLVRWASLGGLIMMLLYLFSSNYPGAQAPFWEYFGASLDHSVLALCFLTFLIGKPDAVWAIRLGRSTR